jgi:hypothetical protein
MTVFSKGRYTNLSFCRLFLRTDLKDCTYMGRRGPKSFADMHDPASWQREWLWFFSGLRNGFPAEIEYEWIIPPLPKLQTHPVLLEELRKKEMIVTRKERLGSGFPAEQKTWTKLLEARTIPDVRKACGASRYWLRNPRIFYYLALLCDQLGPILLAAKKERRYPKAERPTSDERRSRFLALAMAGACMGIAPRYANEVLPEL